MRTSLFCSASDTFVPAEIDLRTLPLRRAVPDTLATSESCFVLRSVRCAELVRSAPMLMTLSATERLTGEAAAKRRTVLPLKRGVLVESRDYRQRVLLKPQRRLCCVHGADVDAPHLQRCGVDRAEGGRAWKVFAPVIV